MSVAAVSAAGFAAAYISPFGVAAAALGPPSSTLWPSYVAHIRSMADLSTVNLIVDGHSGFEGGRTPANVVAELEAAGAWAVVIEDREEFRAGAHLKPMSTMAREIASIKETGAAAVNLVVRSDALRDCGPDELAQRCRAFVRQGADLVMPLLTPLMSVPDTESLKKRRLALQGRLTETVGPGRLVVHSPTGEHLSRDEAEGLQAAVYILPQLLLAERYAAESAALTRLSHGPLYGHTTARRLGRATPGAIATLTEIQWWLEQRW